MHHISDQTQKWVEDQLEGKILSWAPMPGGMSSQISLLKIKKKNSINEVVLREYTDTQWLKTAPSIAFQEAENLKQAEQVSLSTPICLAVDGHATQTTWPSLLMSHLKGSVELRPEDFNHWLDQLAKALFMIHQINAPSIKHHYFPYFDSSQPVKADWSSVPEKWEKAFKILKQQKRPDFLPTFIHRDFHPTNVLFEKGEVSAVVDWPNACIGPREIDIAHCRWNLAMLYGQKAANDFLKAYLAMDKHFTYDYYWDLEALGNVFSEERPEVYGGWQVFGNTNITQADMIERMDVFLMNALEKQLKFQPE
ncbi:phosphotransferase family protein [Alkalibacterium sp.]|nr:MAG: aminoglycoside phosphotransferase family protein [Alkalibacterium sp.]